MRLALSAFAASGLLVLGLAYTGAEFLLYEQLSGIALIGMLLLLRRRSWRIAASGISIPQAILLFTSSSLVLLIVVGTGGWHSPLFLLIFLYALCLALLLGATYLAAFWGIAVLTVTLTLLVDPDGLATLTETPALPALYALSMAVLLPLGVLLGRSFARGRSLVSSATQVASTAATIIDNLAELIVVTDTGGNILSANGSLERVLRQPVSSLVGKNVFDVLFIKSPDGHMVGFAEIMEKLGGAPGGYDVPDVHVLFANIVGGVPATVSVVPITGPGAQADQISIIVHLAATPQASVPGSTQSENLQVKRRALQEALLAKLVERGNADLVGYIEMSKKLDREISIADNLSKPPMTAVRFDVQPLVAATIASRKPFAQLLLTQLQYSPPTPKLRPEEVAPLPGDLAVDLGLPAYAVQSDPSRLSWLLAELVDLFSCFAAIDADRTVAAVLSANEATVTIRIHTRTSLLTEADTSLLEAPNFQGSSFGSHLQWTSGLEGNMARQLADQLGVSLTFDYHKGNRLLAATVSLPLAQINDAEPAG
jgi:PAS domain-containing protein